MLKPPFQEFLKGNKESKLGLSISSFPSGLSHYITLTGKDGRIRCVPDLQCFPQEGKGNKRPCGVDNECGSGNPRVD